MTAVDILLRLRGQNVRVWVANGELRYEAPSGALNGELRTQVEANAEDIVRYLENADDCVSSTHYVPMRDGVRIAIDIFRPKRNGEIVRNPLPAIWCHDRYHRSSVRDGLVVTKLDTLPWLRTVMRNGYVVAAADARGTGASSGSRHREFSEEETCDAYDITEWLAGQPWCDKRVGMYGDSYLGIAQLLASGTAPPHLKAIFPQMAMFDLYDFVYPGGVFREPFVRCWSEKVRSLDVEHAAAPVDGHSGALAEVTAEHQDNANVFELASAEPYRDAGPYRDQSPRLSWTRLTHREWQSTRSPVGSTCGFATPSCGLPTYECHRSSRSVPAAIPTGRASTWRGAPALVRLLAQGHRHRRHVRGADQVPGHQRFGRSVARCLDLATERVRPLEALPNGRPDRDQRFRE